jgi:hypothetical protein
VYLVIFPPDAAAGGGVQEVLEAVVAEHLRDLHLLRVTVKKNKLINAILSNQQQLIKNLKP